MILDKWDGPNETEQQQGPELLFNRKGHGFYMKHTAPKTMQDFFAQVDDLFEDHLKTNEKSEYWKEAVPIIRETFSKKNLTISGLIKEYFSDRIDYQSTEVFTPQKLRSFLGILGDLRLPSGFVFSENQYLNQDCMNIVRVFWVSALSYEFFVAASTIVSQTEDTVAWIMKWGAEVVDEVPKMREKLERLEGALEKAMKAHKTIFRTDMNNIRQVIEIITYSTTEWLDYEIIDLQTIFTGLQGVSLSDEDKELFENLYFQFMEKGPEVQASMLWFFELVSTYVFAKISDLTIHTNPLKNILFSENNISYKQWISGIFEGFEKNEAGMILLGKSIQNAEAPKIGYKQFIRHLFDTKPEVMDKEDRTFLQKLYTQWPDEEVTNKNGTISSEDKKERDRIAKKYIFDHSEHGVATDIDKTAAYLFKAVVKK